MKTPSANPDIPVAAKAIEPRSSIARGIRHRAEAAVFFSVMALFKALGVDAASALGGAIGRHIYYRLPVVNRARENLRLAFPDKTKAEREGVLRAMCDSLGRTVSEYPHLGSISSRGTNPRISIIEAAVPKASVESGRPVIFISGHFANWEVMAIGAYESGFDAATVFRPPNNPYVDRWIANKRMQSGFKEQIAKSTHGMRRIFTCLRRGKIVCFLVDQKTNEGIASPFFGRDAMTTPAPAALALKMNAILQPVSIRRLKGANFEVGFPPALTFAATGDHDRDIADLTAVINAHIERQVRKDPAQWLWVHRRWPAERDATQIAQGKRRQQRGEVLTSK